MVIVPAVVRVVVVRAEDLAAAVASAVAVRAARVVAKADGDAVVVTVVTSRKSARIASSTTRSSAFRVPLPW